jgi:hypothetical protein
MLEDDEKYLRERYRFRDRSDIVWTEIKNLEQIETSVWRVLESQHEYDRDRILQNDDLVYLPITWIGCVGVLVSKADGRVMALGSPVHVSAHVWAYYRGFADGDTTDERLNDLIILRITDERRTEDVLRRFLTFRHIVNVVRPGFQQLPFRITGVDLYFARGVFKEADEQGWFDFEVVPSTRDDA